ncbi:hypothetical protein [Nitrosopumilus sp.]|uniref:hypothetical protein n=1 Tax=Nitrosopumilus sp. TaxID=2024843 RepID=UPI003D0F5075
MLIDKKIGDIERLKKIQLKLARGLPMFAKNEVYLDELVLQHLTPEEIEDLICQVDEIKLEKINPRKEHVKYHCISCGNPMLEKTSTYQCHACRELFMVKMLKFMGGNRGFG